MARKAKSFMKMSEARSKISSSDACEVVVHLSYFSRMRR